MKNITLIILLIFAFGCKKEKSVTNDDYENYVKIDGITNYFNKTSQNMMSGSDSMNEYIYWAYYLSMSQIQSSALIANYDKKTKGRIQIVFSDEGITKTYWNQNLPKFDFKTINGKWTVAYNNIKVYDGDDSTKFKFASGLSTVNQ